MTACVAHEEEEADQRLVAMLDELSPAAALLLADGKGDEWGASALGEAADETPGASSFQYWIMYSVIKLLPSVREGVHVREMPLLQIPSIVMF